MDNEKVFVHIPQKYPVAQAVGGQYLNALLCNYRIPRTDGTCSYCCRLVCHDGEHAPGWLTGLLL